MVPAALALLVWPRDAQADACEDAAAKADWRACAAPECPLEIREECERALGPAPAPASASSSSSTPAKPAPAETERSPLRYVGPIALGVTGIAATTWGIGSFIAWSVKKENLSSSGTTFGSNEYFEHDKKITRLGKYWAAASIGGIVAMTVSLAWFFAVNKPKTTAIAPTPDGFLVTF